MQTPSWITEEEKDLFVQWNKLWECAKEEIVLPKDRPHDDDDESDIIIVNALNEDRAAAFNSLLVQSLIAATTLEYMERISGDLSKNEYMIRLPIAHYFQAKRQLAWCHYVLKGTHNWSESIEFVDEFLQSRELNSMRLCRDMNLLLCIAMDEFIKQVKEQ